MHQVAHLYHLPQIGVLYFGNRRNTAFWESLYVDIQDVPLLARKCRTFCIIQISHEIYKRIQKSLERVKLDQYNSHFGIALSFLCTHTVAILMKLICKIAVFIDSKHIEEVEKHILDIIKTLEYKKAAINMRHQAVPSDANRDLNSSEFSISAD